MISALILAAGQSKRMGQPKMLLPWGEKTVLETVIATFKAGGMEDILVVTGGDRKRVEALVGKTAQTVFNQDYALNEMLGSIQAGLAGLKPEVKAVLIGLGDQPQVQESSVRSVLEEYCRSGATLVVPSFEMRRGHPWIVGQQHWDEILQMRSPKTMRDFLNLHASEIHYVELNTSTILQDLDTPEDYLKSKPEGR